MARYHMIVNSGTIPVYRRSDCSGPCGELYPGEVFVNLGVTTGYLNVNEVRFIDPDGRYTLGFINSYDGSYGNLAYSGTLQNMTNLGSCYCFRLKLHGRTRRPQDQVRRPLQGHRHGRKLPDRRLRRLHREGHQPVLCQAPA